MPAEQPQGSRVYCNATGGLTAMAMRLYSREEFEADIAERWGLSPTENSTASVRFWMTRGGCHISIPVLDHYPDYWLDEVKAQIEAVETFEGWWTKHEP